MSDIEVMPVNLTDLRFIEILLLLNNRITHLPDMSPMVNLRTLRVSSNALTSISDMVNPPPVKGLYLQDNMLTTFPEFPDVEWIGLEGNPLDCNMSLCWIRMTKWMETYITMEDDPVCALPPAVAGQLLMEVYPVAMECYRGMYIKW